MNPSHDRFARQVDLVPLARLREETITVIGVGAVGRQVALQLAALGVSNLQLIDHDQVELTNVTSQGYLADDVGRPKVEATADLAQQIDHQLAVETIRDRFRPVQKLGTTLFCCVDSISTRAVIWRAVEHRARFWADARMLGETLRVLTASNPASRQYYATTLFAQAEAQVGSCTSRSTIYAAAITAALMVHQFTRWLRSLPLDADTSVNLLSSEWMIGGAS